MTLLKIIFAIFGIVFLYAAITEARKPRSEVVLVVTAMVMFLLVFIL